MLSINTNLSSLIAQNSMKTSTDKLNQAIERMSTGFKINHAKDNAANYSISTDMTTKIGAYQVAEDNCAQGLDMVATASNTISMLQDKTTRLHALSTQARNGTYGAQSLNAINAEANALMTEISRLYNSAQFNGTNLFNQKEMEIADHLPKAKAEYNGFIENPFTYTDEELEQMLLNNEIKPLDSSVTTFTSGQKYLISDEMELQRLATLVNSGRSGDGAIFILGADIDLASIDNWTPIGNATNQFKGTFDGNGHVIRNLKIDRPTEEYVGLFGYANGKILKNVGLDNIVVNGKRYVGGLSGFGGIISNVFVKGNILSNAAYAGGIVGCSNCDCLRDLYTVVNIVSSHNHIGGIAGLSYSSIENCYSSGSIIGYGMVGGLFGSLYDNNHINNSYSKCDIKSKYTSGGISGLCYSPGSIHEFDNAYSYSNVFSELNMNGSFVGNFAVQDYIGRTADIQITDCYVSSVDIPIAGCFEWGGDGVGYISLPDYDTSFLDGISILDYKALSTTIQVGINSQPSSNIKFATNFDFGLSIDSGIESDSALNSINDFLALLESKQTELGAVQNRLESALDEISIKYENLVSSRSTLRDADIAKVSSTYIQQQILQQASATLMATANQSPAIALQLI